MPLNFEVFIPDGAPLAAALARTTHMCIAAHQDDVEIMAYHGILECYNRPDKWFAGAVITDGGGSPRTGPYADYTDEQMRKVRAVEQKRAAFLGGYGSQSLLNFTSAVVKDAGQSRAVVAELSQLLERTTPEVVYTHSPADKHDTHVAVLLRAISAIRRMNKNHRPKRLLGCEVWRGLDWLVDDDKEALNVGGKPHLEAALLGAFDSQISGGKRYDLAAAGRRLSNATFAEHHAADDAAAVTYAIDLTPLIEDDCADVAGYTSAYVDRLRADITERIRRFA